MEQEVDPEIIKTTQNSLGKYVKRPPLSEKLLKKPPFRFLHDIVTTVLKTTGFFDGLFDEVELTSDNVKDRDSKVNFLNKVITVLAVTTGKTLTAKPSKIVAGQEPEKTNEFLQCLAYALDNKLSSQDAVKRVREGPKTDKTKTDKSEKKSKESTKPVKKVADEKRLTSKSSEKLTVQKKDSNDKLHSKNEKNIVNSKTKPAKDIRKEAPSIQAAKSRSEVKKTSDKSSKANKVLSENNNAAKITSKIKEKSETTNVENTNKEFEPEQSQEVHSEQTKDVNDEIDKDEAPLNASYVISDTDLNSTLSSQDLMETENVKAEAIEPNEDSNETQVTKVEDQALDLVRSSEVSKMPTTSEDIVQANDPVNMRLLRDIKKIKSLDSPLIKEIETVNGVLRSPISRPSSSRPGAPRPRDKHENAVTGKDQLIVGKVNIIHENTSIEEEEDTSIIIVESKDNEAPEKNLQLSTNQHGHLVQQILDSTKEFSQTTGKTEIEWQFDALKAKQATSQEIEVVRVNIQALSRVANPLGKLLDHIQEDVEVMRQELQQWTKTYEDTSRELLKQKTANEESLFPLHTKIKQLTTDIEEKHEKINDLKVTIHKNATRIEKLLSTGNVQ